MKILAEIFIGLLVGIGAILAFAIILALLMLAAGCAIKFVILPVASLFF